MGAVLGAVLTVIGLITIIFGIIAITYPHVFNQAAQKCREIIPNVTLGVKTGNLCVTTPNIGNDTSSIGGR